jgi:hypothetical protein
MPGPNGDKIIKQWQDEELQENNYRAHKINLKTATINVEPDC